MHEYGMNIKKCIIGTDLYKYSVRIIILPTFSTIELSPSDSLTSLLGTNNIQNFCSFIESLFANTGGVDPDSNQTGFRSDP